MNNVEQKYVHISTTQLEIRENSMVRTYEIKISVIFRNITLPMIANDNYGLVTWNIYNREIIERRNANRS